MIAGSFRRLFITLFSSTLCCALSASPFSMEVWKAESLLNSYTRALTLIEGGYSDELLFSLDTGDVAGSHLDFFGEVQFVTRGLGTGTTNSQRLMARADEFLVPELWAYLKERELRPTLEEAIAYRNQHAERYATDDWIIGSYLVVEDSTLSATTVTRIAEGLSSGTPFRTVAREYYRGQGEEKDGSFGRVERGQISEEIFRLFFEHDPREPFFGPERTRPGYLFGKLEDRGLKGFQPLDQIRPIIERRMAMERFHAFSEDFFASEEKEQSLVRHWKSGEKAPSANEVVYTIRGRDVTYRDVLERLVEVLGDRASYAFFESVTNTDIREQLVLGSEEADRVRRSPEFQFLYGAVLSHGIYARLLKERMNGKPDTEELCTFYEANKSKGAYSGPDEITFVAVELAMYPRRNVPVNEQQADRRRAWTAAGKLREELDRAEDPLRFSLADLPADLKPRRFVIDECTPLDSVPKPYADLARTLEPGMTSPVVVGKHTYLILHLLERCPGKQYTFDSMLDRVRAEYQLARRKSTREALLREARTATATDGNGAAVIRRD